MSQKIISKQKKNRKILGIQPIYDFYLEQFWWTQIIIGKIHWQESEPTDIHGVICETTKVATSDFGICDYEADSWHGSFSFKGTNSSDEIQCSQLVKTGF